MYSPLEDALTIADKTFTSRLLIGSSMYPNNQIMLDSIEASGAQIVTVAIRRIDLAGGGETVLDLLEGSYHIWRARRWRRTGSSSRSSATARRFTPTSSTCSTQRRR